MKLFEKTNIKSLRLNNRLVMPPMCMYQVSKNDGIANSFHFAHYVSKAISQVGLIIIEATGVTPNGRITDECLGLYDDNQINALKDIVDEVHQQGSSIAIQLNHAGRKSTTRNLLHYGPSEVAYNDKPLDYIAMTHDQINEVINSFKDAAYRAHLAGFDAIELHGAHGYLIHQFISPLSNHRMDEYGKDRFLFLKQIVQAIKTVWPQEKSLLLRISATDYSENGLTVEDWIQFFNQYPDLFDLIHVSSGGLVNAPIRLFPGYQLNFAKRIREETQYPTIGVGLVDDPQLILSSLELGYCDYIACGRELLRNPNLFLQLAKMSNRNDLIPFSYQRGYK